MDEIIKLVSEKAGISEEAAAAAVEVIIGQLKENLPAPFDSQVEGLLDGSIDPQDILGMVGGSGGLGGILKSLFGGK